MQKSRGVIGEIDHSVKIWKKANRIDFSETDSGKTDACGITLVQRIEPKSAAIQALILCYLPGLISYSLEYLTE